MEPLVPCFVFGIWRETGKPAWRFSWVSSDPKINSGIVPQIRPPQLSATLFPVRYLTLKMVATCYFKTSVGFQQATQHYIPEDRVLHNDCCKNLNSYEQVKFVGTIKKGKTIPVTTGPLKKYSVALARKRTIPTGRPPLVGEVSANPSTWRKHYQFLKRCVWEAQDDGQCAE
jgi:hypothetical protein